MPNRGFKSLAVAAATVIAAAVVGSAQGSEAAAVFTVHSLVSDSSATPAPATDASLVNPWGLSDGPTTPWWSANNGTSTSTLYGGTGAKVPLNVTVPGAPTGTVFNPSATDFS